MKKSILLIALLALLVSACGGGGGPAVPNTNALSTQIAATVNAALNLVPTSGPVVVPPTKAPDVVPPAPTKESVVPPVNPKGGSFSSIAFSIGEDSEEPVDAQKTFPDGVTKVYAIFSGLDLADGQPWRHEWYYNGELQDALSDSSTWDASTAGPNAVWWLTIYNDVGIRTGKWELRLYIDDQVVQSGQFTIAKNGSPDFGPIIFAGNVNAKDEPVDPVDVSDPYFTADTTEVYAFWSGIDVPSGQDYTREWYRNGELLQTKDDTWDFGPTEQNWVSFASNDSSTPLTAGTYELKLIIDGSVVNIGSFVIGSN